MRRIFTFKPLLGSVAVLCLLSYGELFAQTCVPVTVITNCQTGITENFNDDATIASSGFSEGDFTLEQQGNNKFLEVTLSGTGVRSVITNTFVAPALNGTINVRFDLSGNAATSSQMMIFVRTQNGDIPLCTVTAHSGLNCFTFLTPATLANQLLKFFIQFTLSGNNRVVQFDNFGTSVSASLIPLPVDFVSFNATRENTATRLTWKVGTEQNLKGYEIEKSADGRQFTVVGFVPATGQTSYTFRDAQISQGPVFYRIRNVDIDGQFKYSNILSLKNGISNLVLTAYPLPAANKLTIQHEAVFGQGRISISTADGSLVKKIVPAKGSLETVVNLAGLKSGFYVLLFDSGNGKLQTMKFLKQ